MTVPSGVEFARLSALIARQRDQRRRLESGAAARSVIDLARGILMERLGCSPAEAQAQLEHLSAESGTSLDELAGQITGATHSGATRNQVDGGATAGSGTADDMTATAHRVARAGAAAEAAPDAGAVATAVLEEALAPAGAVAVALWRAEPDGGLELAGQAGFPAGDASRWRRIHPDMDTLPQRAAGQGAESWWPSGHPEGVAIPVLGRWPAGRAGGAAAAGRGAGPRRYGGLLARPGG